MAFALRLPDSSGGGTVDTAAIAAAVRAELATELGRIDVALSSRASSGSATSLLGSVDALLTRLTAARALLLDNLTRLDVPVSQAGQDAVRVEIT